MYTLKDRAEEVIATWNSHDLDRFLGLHAQDLVYTSPFARRMVPHSQGTLTGLEAIRPLWRKALELHPAIHSTIISIFEGIDSVAVYYTTTARTTPVLDVMQFDAEGKVCRLDVFHG